jgi:parallel beta-helix repeat protein
MRYSALALVMVLGQAALGREPLPERMVVKDDTVITQSCRVLIHPTAIIPDANNNGVIQIGADGITVEFAENSVLRGASEGTAWDTLTGLGIAINGHKNITLRGVRVHGYKVGVRAREADGLVVDVADLSDNYRQRLKSTPEREDSSDWLFPHDNDEQQWVTQHGAALCVEKSNRVTIRNVRVRRGQNGIILDRVNHGLVYDNDCSFLSGWGLAMWRSSENTISRNAFDFCVRGHSEGVYNRGQDSAGILCFEQCNHNVFVENSVTHGGDGFFGFAGKEALGERHPLASDFYTVPRGCNDNVFVGNDFSFASAHGLELTFSHRNVITNNRFVENAVCGIWGGYSRDTLISGNTFTGNGGMAYGLERGAINIEHGSENVIVKNTFTNNLCGVHLWWDDDGTLLELPGVKRTYAGVSRNVIAENTFEMNADHPFKHPRHANAKMIGTQVRNVGDKGTVEGNIYAHNVVKIGVPNAIEMDSTSRFRDVRDELDISPDARTPKVDVLGSTKPVGARAPLAGRRNIIMEEWGPWDHESPMIRKGASEGDAIIYEIRGVPGTISATDLVTGTTQTLNPPDAGEPSLLRVSTKPGVNSYEIRLESGAWSQVVRGSTLRADWECSFLTWGETSDPRKDLDAWHALATAATAKVVLPSLDLPFAHGGPRDLAFAQSLDTKDWPGRDHFGTVARAKLNLPPGTWRFITTSDDGIRVRVDDKTIIDNWTWHAPTRDVGTVVQTKASEVEIVVEHFEIDGYAMLKLEIQRSE